MMKLVNADLDIKIEFDGGSKTKLIFCSVPEYSRMVNTLYEQLITHTGSWVLSKNNKELKIENEVSIITSPFHSPYSSTELRTAIIQKLLLRQTEVEEDFLIVRKYADKILATLCMGELADLNYDITMTLKDFLKLNTVSTCISDDSEFSTVFERLTGWIKAEVFLRNKQVIILGDMSQYLQQEELEVFLGNVLSDQISVIILCLSALEEENQNNQENRLRKVANESKILII